MKGSLAKAIRTIDALRLKKEASEGAPAAAVVSEAPVAEAPVAEAPIETAPEATPEVTE